MNYEVPEESKASHQTTMKRTSRDNYRGIAVISFINRMKAKDQLQTMFSRLLKQLRRERQEARDLPALCRHYIKTFDSEPTAKLWQALDKNNIKVERITAVKYLYYQYKTIKQIDKIWTQGFKVYKMF